MTPRIVTTHYRYKRPPRKRAKAAATTRDVLLPAVFAVAALLVAMAGRVRAQTPTLPNSTVVTFLSGQEMLNYCRDDNQAAREGCTGFAMGVEGIMSEQTHGKVAAIRAKFIEEFKAMAALAAYLYVCFGAILLFKNAALRDAGIHDVIWGLAAIKALLLAKFMLLGRMLHVGTRFRDKPLIWPTLYHALMFLIVLLVLTMLEELIVGFIHGRAMADSLNHVVGPIFFEGLAVCLIMFLILVPYSAFTCLSDVVGEHETIRLFFVSRDVDGAVRDRLTPTQRWWPDMTQPTLTNRRRPEFRIGPVCLVEFCVRHRDQRWCSVDGANLAKRGVNALFREMRRRIAGKLTERS